VPKKVKRSGPKRSSAKRSDLSVTEQVVELLRTQFKDPSAATTLANGGYSQVREVLPTRLEVVDRYVLGVGGLPYGRVVEISGGEGVGKSSFVNHLIACAQADGAVATLGDSERKVAPNWCDIHGVNRKDVVLLPARTIEEYLDEVGVMVEKFPRQKQVHFLDSVATTDPQKAIDEALQDKEVPGAQAAAWSRGLRRYVKPINEHRGGALLVLVNQLRSKVGVLYGPTEDTACGRAIKYYCSLRIAMYHGATTKEGDRKTGKWATMVAFKNQVAIQGNKAKIYMDFAKGFSDGETTLAHAREVGCIGEKSNNLAEARANLGWAPLNESEGGSDAGAGSESADGGSGDGAR
jgi:recombination protein RecA